MTTALSTAWIRTLALRPKQRPRQLDLEHRQERHRQRQEQWRESARQRACATSSSARSLFVLREFVGQHLEAVADHGIVQRPFGDRAGVELDSRVAHAEVDRRFAYAANFLQRPLVAVGAGGAVHAADAEGGDLDRGSVRRRRVSGAVIPYPSAAR